MLAGCTAVLDVLELDARIAEVPEGEKPRGIRAAFSQVDENDRLYRTLELD